MILHAKFINKEQPTLLIKKTSKLKTEKDYIVKIIDSKKKDAVLNGYLRNFKSEYFGMKFSHKIMEAFGLEYNKEYEVEVEEEK